MDAETKRCPYCDEEIRVGAIKCKHCGSFLDGSATPSPSSAHERPPHSPIPGKIEGDSLSAPEHKEKAESLRQKGQYDEAEAEIKKAIELDPADESLQEFLVEIDALIQKKHLARAGSLRKDNKFGEAVFEYTSVLERNPQSEEAIEGLEKAQNMLERLRNHLTRGDEFRKKGKYLEAIAEYEQVLKVNPNHTYATSEAEQCRRILSEKDSLAVKASDTLKVARTEYESKKYRRAIFETQKILEKSPDHAEALKLLKDSRKRVYKKQRNMLLVAFVVLACGIYLFSFFRFWNYSKYESCLAESRVAIENGHWIDAVDCAGRALDYRPNEEQALALMSEAIYQLRKLAEVAQKGMLDAKERAEKADAMTHAEVLWAQAAEHEAEAHSCMLSVQFETARDDEEQEIEIPLDDALKKTEDDKPERNFSFISKQIAAMRRAEKVGMEAPDSEAADYGIQAGAHLISRQYESAARYYKIAMEQYEKAEQASLKAVAEAEQFEIEKTAEEKEEAELALAHVQKAKAYADSHQVTKYIRESYTQAEQEMKAGNEKYRNQNYTAAVHLYQQAANMFREAAENVREGRFLPAGLVMRNGKILSIKDGVEMMLIPEGSFLAGSHVGEGAGNEQPRHKVYLDAFYMDRFEVTIGQYEKFVEETGRFLPPEWVAEYSPDENHPVVGVTWEDAQAYCEWAGKRLPTEAEWEYACCAGTTTGYNVGNNITHSHANYSKTDGKDTWDQQTAPVASFPPNRWGLYDMHGNVWEWCQDWYGRNYYSNSPKKNPTGPTDGSSRVIRGGSWKDSDYDLRCASRGYSRPASAENNIGFRCAK